MRLCPACGHHHGTQDNTWPSCQGRTETPNGGAKRCACTSPEPQRTAS